MNTVSLLIIFQEYSIILVIPDIWDRFYVKDLINLLLVGMGFKQVTCQQVSEQLSTRLRLFDW